MSKSRSATPTPNIYAPATTNSSAPTSSRTPTNDPTTTTTAAPDTTRHLSDPSSAPIQQQFPHVHSFVSSQTSPDDHPRPSPDPSSPPPMAKRMRRSSPDDESSDSQSRQGGEGELDEPQSRSSSEASRSPQAQRPLPLKKKRTRTLTTPHQSAVLHALLAQSRFPTTAMREEVGRAIGLSARKVQIWFQNQRQKARRPGAQQQQSQSQSQSGVVASQPYPTYPNLLAPAPGVYPGASPYSGYPPVDAQLLGPGMPGPSTSSNTSAPRQRGRPVLHVSPTEYARELPPIQHSPYSTRENVLPPFRPRAHDPARTLPPLDFSLSSRRGELHSHSHSHSPSSYLLGGSAPPTPFRASPPASGSASTSASFRASPPMGLTRSRSSSPQFAHNPPPREREPQLPPFGLPPPFTFPPQLHWGTRRPPSGPGISSSSWSHAGPSTSTRTSSGSPPRLPPIRSPSPADEDQDTPRLGAAQPPPSRAGRYDPVRGGFVSYSPTGTPSPPA
ncbi:hypothetical protein C8F01DRAFT_1088655 [Mycena amicta]|nr:hypothetical protein C8F01DRAFT_1088655 [Mycena amicta]